MKALTKDIFREISKTRSRFISILVMIMLAALFLCGLRSAAPDMQITADRYYDTQKLMDLQVISTLGLVEEDLEALLALEGVAYAEGSWSLDARAVKGSTELLLVLTSADETARLQQLQTEEATFLHLRENTVIP